MAPPQAVQRAGRLPQAPASLLVQLPPNELLKFQESQADGGVVEASDLRLLASSIQARREREAGVFTRQQQLIDGGDQLTREELKRAVSEACERGATRDVSLTRQWAFQMTQLSLSTWLQVLQERHLDNHCAYPTCSRRPKRRHLSARDTILPLDAPRYRISLSNRRIERDERDDPGGENSYCSKACWRRGEWVSRWVLQGGSSSRKESCKEPVRDGESRSAIRAPSEGLGAQVDEGGRWERLVDEDNWEQVELLEDLEEGGEIERLSDDENIARQPSTTTAKPRLSVPPSSTSAGEDKPTKGIVAELDHFSTMLDSLSVVERPTVSSPAAARESDVSAPPTVLSTAARTSPQGPPVRLMGMNKARNEEDPVRDSDKEVADISDGDSDDMDVLAELSMRSRVEGEDDIVSTILASSRHLQIVDEGSGVGRDEEWSEEECRRHQEEEELFALAWQARDEEIAKGSWHD